MKVKSLVVWLLCSLPLVSVAQERTNGAALKPVTVPSSAEAWLELQRSGQVASSNAYRASATEQELAVQRWLKSFTHVIPDFFEREDLNTGD